MQRQPSKQFFLAGVCGWFVLCAAGCSTRTTNEFVPAKASARKALEQALTAWQNGQSNQVADVSPKVNAVDSRWKTGARPPAARPACGCRSAGECGTFIDGDPIAAWPKPARFEYDLSFRLTGEHCSTEETCKVEGALRSGLPPAAAWRCGLESKGDNS